VGQHFYSASLSFLFKVPPGYELVFQLPLKYDIQRDVSPRQTMVVREEGQKDDSNGRSDQ
jgi:hypothetical protein